MLNRHRTLEAEFGCSPVKSGDGDGVIERIMQPSQVSGFRCDDQIGPKQPQVVTLTRAEHHAMLAKADGFTITVDRRMAHLKKGHQLGCSRNLSIRNLIRPDLEAFKYVGSERGGDRNI